MNDTATAHTDDNPLLTVAIDPPYERVRPEHVVPAITALLAEARTAVDAVAQASGPRTYENTLRALEVATEKLEFAMEIVGHLESVATTPALREAYNTVQPEVSAFDSSIPLNDALWKAVSAYAATDEAKSLTGARARHLMRTMDYFKSRGADLPQEKKDRLRTVATELSEVTTRFGQNVLDANAAWELYISDETQLAGLPDSAREMARESAKQRGREGHRFTLQAPSYLAVMTYLDDARIRETVWRAYNTRGTKGEQDNRPLLKKILKLRKEMATLLGYRDFADFVLHDRMAKNGAKARSFIAELEARTRPFAVKEDETLLAFRRRLEGDDAPALSPWDVAYYAEKERRALHDFDEEALRPYLRADSVLSGMFETVKRLYGIEVVPRSASVWHPDVRAFSVRDPRKNNEEVGRFFVDLHPRESKRDGAWMGGVLSFPPGEGPQVGLFCANATPPSGDRPALLTHAEVETLFHEFGHLLHHILSRVEVRSLAGTRVAWDFVELPSQIMENWCWEREALDLFARHVDTGERVPDALFDKMLRARNYRAANAMLRQLGFASVDLALHCDFDPESDADPVTYARDVLQRFNPTKLPDDYAMIAAFGHLFASPTGYAAAYYSYKWAEVLDADAFSRFKQEGVFSSKTGAEFRDRILSRGDSADPAELYRDFMGREARVDALFERSGLTGA